MADKYTTNTSCLLGNMEALRTSLSKCAALQELSETTESELLAAIRLGPAANPEDLEQFDVEELENELMYVQVAPMNAGHVVARRNDSSYRAHTQTMLNVYIARQARQAEWEGSLSGGFSDMWKWYTDRAAFAMETEVWDAADGIGFVINSATMAGFPSILGYNRETGEGQRFEATWVFDIGRGA